MHFRVNTQGYFLHQIFFSLKPLFFCDALDMDKKIRARPQQQKVYILFGHIVYANQEISYIYCLLGYTFFFVWYLIRLCQQAIKYSIKWYKRRKRLCSLLKVSSFFWTCNICYEYLFNCLIVVPKLILYSYHKDIHIQLASPRMRTWSYYMDWRFSVTCHRAVSLWKRHLGR